MSDTKQVYEQVKRSKVQLNHKRTNVMKEGVVAVQSLILGMCNHTAAGIGIKKETREFIDITKSLNKIVKRSRPDFTYNAIALNANDSSCLAYSRVNNTWIYVVGESPNSDLSAKCALFRPTCKFISTGHRRVIVRC